MVSLTEDESRWNLFEEDAGSPIPYQNTAIQVMDWTLESATGREYSLNPVTDLETQPDSDLRLIFAPLDLPDHFTISTLLYLFKAYKIPSDFLSERLQSVTHSLKSNQNDDGSESLWFHFLCKNITVRTKDGNPRNLEIIDPAQRSDGRNLSNDSHDWIRAGFFLNIANRSIHRQSESTGRQITMICFGASESIIKRFRRLLDKPKWEEIIPRPYLLVDIVLNELYLKVDNLTWNLNGVFGNLEGVSCFCGHDRKLSDRVQRILGSASLPGLAAERLDFVGLYNIAKLIIYMKESVKSMIYIIDNMIDSPFIRGHNPSKQDLSSISYRKGVCESTQQRITSMEKRMENLIQLSFNLVTQQDSRSLQLDNKLMTVIAVVTLFFLPLTTIASIFGTQFFALTQNDAGNSYVFRMSQRFWIFWAISIGITGFVLLASWYYFKRVAFLVMGQQQPRRTGTALSELAKMA
jgi:Mg2+ and Co2+ transporter CorA